MNSPVQAPGEAAEKPLERDWAICCSGGGIRSASYCLGALQSLGSKGLLSRVNWILGVSGGSYIASSRALVAQKLGRGPHEEPPYAPGSPEELNLRDNTRYIAPDGATVLAGLLSLILGAMVTFVIATAPLYAGAHAWGWLLRAQGVLVPSSPHAHTLTAQVTAVGWLVPTLAAAGILLLLFAFWWLTLQPVPPREARHWWMSLKPDDPDRGANRARVLSWSALLAAGLALAMLGAPPAISWLTHSTGPVGTIAHFVGFGARPTWSFSALAGVIAAVTVVARFCQAGLAKWNKLGGLGQDTGTAAKKTGLLTQLGGMLRQKLLPWLASTVIVVGLAALVLLWMGGGASAGFSGRQLVPVLVALAIVVLTRAVANVNRLAMHDFYRWRLANAFAITRTAAEEQEPLQARSEFADAAAFCLSELPHKPGTAGNPGLVICGTANINALREAPPGRGGFCITFDPKNVTLHRGSGLRDKLMDVEMAEARTSDYEALVGRRRFTLFDVSAISGAAISPLMGTATKHAYRLLLTATNIRLGVWLPHPNVVRDARKLLIDPPEADGAADGHGAAGNPAGLPERPKTDWPPLLLLLWYLLPHPLWDSNAKDNHDRECQLWAYVLWRRLHGGRHGVLWYRAMQPTLGLLWAEAAGHLSYRDTWMYVTDGGHYENLGLVEALRRGAKNIVVLDASGDKADTWSTLAGAMTLARVDAGVEIVLDPTEMVGDRTDLKVGEVVRPWAHGTFSRPAGDHGLPVSGNIWVCKLGWWIGAPWDIRSYARSNPTFPCDPTLEQLYDAAEFEAYHHLGAAAALLTAEQWQPNGELKPQPAPAPAPGHPAQGPPGPEVPAQEHPGGVPPQGGACQCGAAAAHPPAVSEPAPAPVLTSAE